MGDDELLDVFDKDMRRTGAAPRALVHARGWWHRTVHVWLASRDCSGSLLFQLRSAKAADNHGLLDATAAGHVRAGETDADAFREAEEELGFAIPWTSARLLGTRRDVRRYDDGSVNREFQAIYLALHDRAWGEFDPRDGEAAGLAWVSNAGGMDLARGRIDALACTAWLAEEAGIVERKIRVERASFVPRTGHYYFAVHAAARRLLARSAARR